MELFAWNTVNSADQIYLNTQVHSHLCHAFPTPRLKTRFPNTCSRYAPHTKHRDVRSHRIGHPSFRPGEGIAVFDWGAWCFIVSVEMHATWYSNVPWSWNLPWLLKVCRIWVFDSASNCTSSSTTAWFFAMSTWIFTSCRIHHRGICHFCVIKTIRSQTSWFLYDNCPSNDGLDALLSVVGLCE